ncbi:MAG: tRNA uridine-5-carboxymethylaminomethyl(34) synthesis enzyme MnmG [Planctomycetota bacterium]
MSTSSHPPHARSLPQGAASSPRATATHPHPAPPAGARGAHDVLVVGGGHAGIEAALAAARLGARVALLSFRADKIGEMSCNPCIGGLGKGQLAREVDALGGAMGEVADRTGIQFRMLNTAKGYAVRGPRAQSDRHRYRDEVAARVRATDGVEIVEAGVHGLLVEERAGAATVVGVRTLDGRELRAPAVVLTTGTFLAAVMHTGTDQTDGGRVGEAAANGLSTDLRRLGLAVGRLKTGTPPRLAREGIDWDALDVQSGDPQPTPFSFLTDRAAFPALPQIDCHVTWTNAETHALIRENVHLAPMYAGRIEGVGPRYCPSVEDKVMRFPDRERHQLFLEPESLDTDVIYVNGISTSLPAEVQEAFVRTVRGLEGGRFLRHGYAVEYDFVQPSQLDPTLHCREVPGLFLAGQINGTSGYEEAAGQGLIAGANAALWTADRAPFVLGRQEAYIGVLIDDLTVSNPTEPYRMFSSRAEYRLLLRQDNADRRLTPRAAEIGLVDAERATRTAERTARIEHARSVLRATREEGGKRKTLEEVLLRPGESLPELARRHPALAALELDADLAVTIEADVKYAGYVERARADIERLERQESVEIPAGLELAGLKGLRNEAREKLELLRPRTLGAAGRIAGINPPDVALLAIHVERFRRAEADQ